MFRRVYGIVLIVLFFGFIVFLNIYKPEKLFDLNVTYGKKSTKSQKMVVEQSIKGVYLVDSQKNDTNWELWAESGLSSSASSSWRFNNVKVSFYTKDKQVYKVISEVGLVDLKEKKMVFEGKILIESPNGYFMKAKTLSYNFEDKIIYTDDSVEIDTDKKKVKEPLAFAAKSMKVDLRDSRIYLQGIKSTKVIQRNKVVKIDSGNAVLSGSSYKIEYKNNVKLTGLNVKVTSNFMRIFVDKKSKKLKHLTAIGNVRVISDNRLGTSGMATLDFKSEVIVMMRSPKLKQGRDVLYGEKIIFYNKTKSVSVKKARAKVDKNMLENYNEPVKGQ